MKNTMKTMVLFFFFLYLPLFGQGKTNGKTFTKNQIATLNMGINSENEGVRKNSVFIAGYYNIHEAVPALKKQFLNETETQLKTLIAMSLLMLGDETSMTMIKAEAAKSENISVKNKLNAIANEIFALRTTK